MKVLRRSRKRFFFKNDYSKYLLYALGEIVLVVIGILIALKINNANQVIKDKDLELQSIDLLITDLEEKKKEILADIESVQLLKKRIKPTIQLYEQTAKIDSTEVEFILRNLASDNSFLNENSPIYLGLSSSNFWRKVPDTLTKKIDAFYRIRLTQVQLTFNKANEYSTYCITNFLRPNDLIYFNLTSSQLIARLRGKEEDYLSYVKLFMNSTQRLEFVLNESAKKIEELVKDLKTYNASKRSE